MMLTSTLPIRFDLFAQSALPVVAPDSAVAAVEESAAMPQWSMASLARSVGRVVLRHKSNANPFDLLSIGEPVGGSHQVRLISVSFLHDAIISMPLIQCCSALFCMISERSATLDSGRQW